MESATSMSGKICMVTGANSGIGKAASLRLAQMGASVVMVCRNRNLGESARSEIQRGAPKAKVILMQADLASQKSVRRLAEDFRTENMDLHVLINNAGVVMRRRVLTGEGIETQMAVNLLAPFLLTNLLLDNRKAGFPARVINVSSRTHRYGRIDFDNLQGEKKYDAWKAHFQTKLGLILVTYELARRLEGTGVTANCLHPGVVATGIMRNFPAPVRLIWNLMFSSPQKGSDTTVYLASSPKVEKVSGKYFEKMRESRSSPASYDVATARKLWDTCARLTRIE